MISPRDQWLYFAQVALIIVFQRLIGYLAKKILRVPRIVGDIIGGCLLGPTLMGPEASSLLFPPATRDLIKVNGNLGLVLASLSAGASFDWRVMKGRVTNVFVFTFLNHAFPICFSLITFFTLPDTPMWRGPNFNEKAYFVFIACIYASTAVSMIFLILDELKLVDDLSRFCLGWSCLSTICVFTMLSVASFLSDPSASYTKIVINLCTLVGLIVVLALIQFLWGLWEDKFGSNVIMVRLTNDVLLIAVVLTLAVTAVTMYIQFSSLLGGFLGGMFLIFNHDIRADVVDKIRWITRWILLPQYFVYVGLMLNLRNLGGEDWGWVFLTMALCMIGKVLTALPLRFGMGYTWRESAFISILANCRGFNGLIVATTANDFKVCGSAFVTLCIFVSVVSSSMAGPLASRWRPLKEDKSEVSTTTESGDGVKLEGITVEKAKSVPPLETGTPFLPSILREDYEPIQFRYLWLEDALSLSRDPHQGILASAHYLQQHPLASPLSAFHPMRTLRHHRGDDSLRVAKSPQWGRSPAVHPSPLPPVGGRHPQTTSTDAVTITPSAPPPFSPQIAPQQKQQGDLVQVHPDLYIFTGKELVDWFSMRYRLPYRKVAEQIGKEWIHRGYMDQVRGRYNDEVLERDLGVEIDSDDRFFTFTQKAEEEKNRKR